MTSEYDAQYAEHERRRSDRRIRTKDERECNQCDAYDEKYPPAIELENVVREIIIELFRKISFL
jgi:hypothetical protein